MHYLAEWSKGSAVFHPKRDHVPLEKIRVFVAAADVPRLDKLAKASGYKRSEWLRHVLTSLLNAAESSSS